MQLKNKHFISSTIQKKKKEKKKEKKRKKERNPKKKGAKAMYKEKLNDTNSILR